MPPLTSNPQAEHKRRLALLQQQLASGEARASVARSSLEGGTVDLRPRHQLQAELRTWEDFDGPMLREEIGRVETSLAKQALAQQTDVPPLAILVPRSDPASEVEQKRRHLGDLHTRRHVAVARVTDRRMAIDVAVSKHEQDGAGERHRYREAIAALAEIDRQIDEVGGEV